MIPTGDSARPSSPEDTVAARKARGAFFTPTALCDHVANWAVRHAGDRVLEPSCGEAAFLLAAAARLQSLGAGRGCRSLSGVELHGPSAEAARRLVEHAGCSLGLTIGDFFDVPARRSYDVVIGNPPYVRYQDFSGDARARGRAAALAGGVGLTNLASSWAAFTVHAAEFLRPGGRLGLVLPAELLTVNYAAPVRRYLMQQFGRVRLVLFTERVFPEIQEEVVLLLADEALAPGGTEHCELHQVRNAGDLRASGSTAGSRPGNGGVAYRWRPADALAKWTPGLLGSDALTTCARLENGSGYTILHSWGETTLGIVTGNNRYFALSPETSRQLGLDMSELRQLSPPGSRHLRGLVFTRSAWAELGAGAARTLLFFPPEDPKALSDAARAYIAAGEAAHVHEAYKCRIRKHWWRVPIVPPADLLLTYMNADTPRLTANRAGVLHLNSVHGVYLHTGLRTLGMDLLPVGALNTMTLLGAETVGRSYGGGLLKLEPREADRLPVPSPDLLRAARPALQVLRPQLAKALRSGEVTAAARLVDQVLLVGELGLSRNEVRSLESAHAALASRRAARGRTPAGSSDAPLSEQAPAGLSRG